MTINKTQENGKIIFGLEGRLDSSSAPQLQAVLIPAFDNAKEITLNLSGLTYVSSAGLRILLMGQRKANKKGCSIIFNDVSEEVMEVFEMTGFISMLAII